RWWWLLVVRWLHKGDGDSGVMMVMVATWVFGWGGDGEAVRRRRLLWGSVVGRCSEGGSSGAAVVRVAAVGVVAAAVGCGVEVVTAAVVVVAVAARDIIGRVIRRNFGFVGKSPPKNFSGGGGVVTGWPAAAGGRRWEEEDG
nr:hypothetical protein [Tanacetum cinerariifolium]